eukprot:TRINITY_DN15224_c0_g1_i1.p1 TRINITY_DN15224_c0_g1~~TRINITY_DN15224_c0_g1_i1.p1  ORF type:complete len:877 (-),score=183.38 TRINITY_DN15224_c0_g1_i1:10-2640(-)
MDRADPKDASMALEHIFKVTLNEAFSESSEMMFLSSYARELSKQGCVRKELQLSDLSAIRKFYPFRVGIERQWSFLERLLEVQDAFDEESMRLVKDMIWSWIVESLMDPVLMKEFVTFCLFGKGAGDIKLLRKVCDVLLTRDDGGKYAATVVSILLKGVSSCVSEIRPSHTPSVITFYRGLLINNGKPSWVEPIMEIVESREVFHNGLAAAKLSLLGPLVICSGIPFSYYSNLYRRAQTEQKDAALMNEDTIQILERSESRSYAEVFHPLLHVSEKTRSYVINWLAKCVNSNWNMSKEYHESSELAPYSFFLSLANLLIRWAENDKLFDDLSKISSDFLRFSSLFPTSLLSPLKFNMQVIPGTGGKRFNTSTELFWIIHMCTLFGCGSMLRLWQRIDDHLRNPFSSRELDEATKAAMSQQKSYVQMTLSSPITMQNLYNFLSISAEYFNSLCQIDIVSYEGDSSNVGVHPHFAAIPEMIVLNASSFAKWCGTFATDIFDQFDWSEILSFFTILGVERTFASAHLRSSLHKGLVTLLNPLKDTELSNAAWQRRVSTPWVRQYFIVSLIRIYVDCARTGSSHQFYEMFNIRAQLQRTLSNLWLLPPFATSTRELQHRSDFSRFTSAVLTDIEHDVTEGMHTISVIQDEEYGSLDPQERASLIRQGNAHLSFAAANSKFWGLIAKKFPLCFVEDELLTVASGLISYIVSKSSTCQTFPEGVQGEPLKDMENTVLSIFEDLCLNDAFCHALVEDRDRFSVDALESVAKRLNKFNVLEIIRAYREHMASIQDEVDIPDDEIPAEYLDGLTYILMRDPVTIPVGSGGLTCHIDRRTTNRIFLGDSINPFTRSTLLKSDVVPDAALRREIAEWITKKKKEMRK